MALMVNDVVKLQMMQSRVKDPKGEYGEPLGSYSGETYSGET